ncbi:short-chain dehydrogenase reductase family [Fusarium acutatum]|uniref:Short-chain dehydrogenase reductase family n=1 Tax=Fusarium acutatum TaxID=78861 RepID=A0A8H4JDZ1_9HYPO|nr:short-chain dehydrogenase reductase family [Fusarium acutatum]
MPFPYKCVVLVGATSGIGGSMAEKLVCEGTKVIVAGRRKGRLDTFVQKHGKDKSGAIVFDIADTRGHSKFVDTVMATYPEVDCIFLNAGIQQQHDLTKPAQLDFAAFHHEVTVNFTSFVNLTYAFLPFLLTKKESTGIIYTGSHLSIIPAFNLPAYSASKAALNAFVQCLRYQLFLAKANVNVIELSPPAVQTELHDETMGERGRSFGMPLDVFTKEAYKGLASGHDQVFIGTVGPQKEGQKDTFMELVDNRRKLFEWLSGVMAAHY